MLFLSWGGREAWLSALGRECCIMVLWGWVDTFFFLFFFLSLPLPDSLTHSLTALWVDIGFVGDYSIYIWVGTSVLPMLIYTLVSNGLKHVRKLAGQLSWNATLISYKDSLRFLITLLTKETDQDRGSIS